ncbi:MAG: tryptophan-rich sensory protein [Bacteroidota bacterium]|nr:tryptophan-rich sensory protein [Bacteroidota bacterium]
MKNSKGPSNTVKLIIAILICEGTGILSGFLSNSGRGTWFDSLVKPEWNPPSYLFGPVWTFLYLLMGISLWLIWKSQAPESQKKIAMWLFAVQLFLNFWWSMIFFKFHSIGLAFAEIIMLWVLILFTIISFSKISKPAAWLLVPYIAWVSFASILNYTIWMLNK